MSASLVGSEMCIRDSVQQVFGFRQCARSVPAWHKRACDHRAVGASGCPVSYTHLTLPTICSV
eukprot:1089982-Alexandrium_andersonii.AAC.1